MPVGGGRFIYIPLPLPSRGVVHPSTAEYMSIITGSHRRRQPQSPAIGEIQAPNRSHDAADETGRIYPETA